jgi:hypothetical protein
VFLAPPCCGFNGVVEYTFARCHSGARSPEEVVCTKVLEGSSHVGEYGRWLTGVLASFVTWQGTTVDDA